MLVRPINRSRFLEGIFIRNQSEIDKCHDVIKIAMGNLLFAGL